MQNWFLGKVLQKAPELFRSLARSLFDSLAEAILPNKSLRILIADEQHFNRLRIERCFNQLGYYAVAPVQSLEELLVLVEYAAEPFDLLLVNAALVGDKLNLLDFCLNNRQLDRVLIYNSQQAGLAIPAEKAQKVQVSPAVLADQGLIKALMMRVDPGLPFVGTVISVR
jgi:PleD family two-component response regulator